MYRCLALLVLVGIAECLPVDDYTGYAATEPYAAELNSIYAATEKAATELGTGASEFYSSSAEMATTEPLNVFDRPEGESKCALNEYFTDEVTGCLECPANTNAKAGSWSQYDCLPVCLYGDNIFVKKMRSGKKGTLSNTLFPAPGYGSNANCYWEFERPGLFETVYMVIEVQQLHVEPGRDKLILSRNYVNTGEEKTEIYSTINSLGEVVPQQTADSETEIGTYWWRTTSFDDVNITFIADAEVNGAGFRLKYAFDDCVELDPLENGHWDTEAHEGRLYYIPECDEGYIARRSTEGVKNRSPLLYFKVGVSSRGFPYCDNDTESENYLKWVNNHYYCAKELHNCYDLQPMIKGAHLEFVSAPNEHTAHYDVVCNKFGNVVAGPSTLECAIVKEATDNDGAVYDWVELYNEEWLYPVCIAKTCDTLEARDDIHVIDSKAIYAPGSYLRERCSLNIDDDETRWCQPDGTWTPVYAKCEAPSVK